MNTLSSMLFGAKPEPVRAVKWLGMKKDEAKDRNDRMFVNAEASRGVLEPLEDQRVNLISIFGAARQGKSFLMNLLADQQDLFKISNLREPCTQGVDLSAHFLPLSTFSTLNGCPSLGGKAKMQIGFVDAEGQGDRDITYDSRLVSPVLLASKVVLFNWKDSLQADRMLNLLAVLARAAQGIELAEGDSSKVFGHLHIVFRDWSFVNSTPEEVFNDLFQKEKGRSEEVNLRNLARTNLVDAFESINIWLFPAPVANTANLKDKIRFEQLQRPFQEQLKGLRTCISKQLQKPMLFNRQPLTARLLAKMMPSLVETLNSDEIIMPESIYSSMVRAEATAVREAAEKSIAAYCEAAGVEEVISSDEFEKTLRQDVKLMISEAADKLSTSPAAMVDEMRSALTLFAEKEIRIAIHANNQRITDQLSKEIDAVFERLKAGCLFIEEKLIPLSVDMLKKKCSELLKRELEQLNAVPLGSHGKRAVDKETSRIKQHATILFEKLEVFNEKAVQKSNAIISDQIRAANTEMIAKAHGSLDRRFESKRPFTVSTMQAGLEEIHQDLVRKLTTQNGKVFASVNFNAELKTHKDHLAEEMNRRYMVEMRQILSDVGYAAKEDLTKEVSFRLDGKMPLAEKDLQREIDGAVKQIKTSMSSQLQGWSILRGDIETKATEIHKLADVLTDDYLRRNSELEQNAHEQKEKKQFEQLSAKLITSFEHDVKAAGFPTTDAKIDAIFARICKKLATEFLAGVKGSSTFTLESLTEELTASGTMAVKSQKQLNSLAVENKHARDLAEKEKRMREQDQAAARKKDAEMSELKSFVKKSLGERDNEAQRLRDQLDKESEKARLLALEVEKMRTKEAQIQAEKRATDLRAKEEALREENARKAEAIRLQIELDELKRQATESAIQNQQMQLRMQEETARKEESRVVLEQLEEMKLKAAELEMQKVQLEHRAREEAIRRLEAENNAREEATRRQDAENAASAAAAAAELSARAAQEAAAQELSEEYNRKRKLSVNSEYGDDDEDMEAPMHVPANLRASGKKPAAQTAERKKQKTPAKPKAQPKPRGKRMSLDEVRKAAQEEVNRRTEERVAKLAASKKK